MRPSLVAPTLNRQQPPAPPSALKKFAPSRCAPDKFALLKVVPRRSAIVSFLNPQPALSLGGNRSSCPTADLRAAQISDRLGWTADVRTGFLRELSDCSGSAGSTC